MGAWEHGSMRAWVLAGLLTGCGSPAADPTASAAFRQLPSDQVILGFEQYVSERGLNKAILTGDTAFVFEDSSVAHVKDVNLVLYDEAGQVSARLTSDAGRLNTFTQAMTATGDVVLITETDGRRIETEELHYDPNTHRIWSDVRTTQRHQGGVLTGTGFEADDKFYNVRIINARSTGGGLRIEF
ncbi:MAG: LPS export ABC transporter periplasmic protein LptC [Gemmatimonadota bacterium]